MMGLGGGAGLGGSRNLLEVGATHGSWWCCDYTLALGYWVCMGLGRGLPHDDGTAAVNLLMDWRSLATTGLYVHETIWCILYTMSVNPNGKKTCMM